MGTRRNEKSTERNIEHQSVHIVCPVCRLSGDSFCWTADAGAGKLYGTEIEQRR